MVIDKSSHLPLILTKKKKRKIKAKNCITITRLISVGFKLAINLLKLIKLGGREIS